MSDSDESNKQQKQKNKIPTQPRCGQSLESREVFLSRFYKLT